MRIIWNPTEDGPETVAEVSLEEQEALYKPATKARITFFDEQGNRFLSREEIDKAVTAYVVFYDHNDIPLGGGGMTSKVDDRWAYPLVRHVVESCLSD